MMVGFEVLLARWSAVGGDLLIASEATGPKSTGVSRCQD